MYTITGLDQNGVVLTGEALQRYSKRKGLCSICAQVATHKRVGKLLNRKKWEPLTTTNPMTGEYVVYKGLCIQPTCHTLDQAKELLGEKPLDTSARSLRRSSQTLINTSLRSKTESLPEGSSKGLEKENSVEKETAVENNMERPASFHGREQSPIQDESGSVEIPDDPMDDSNFPSFHSSRPVEEELTPKKSIFEPSEASFDVRPLSYHQKKCQRRPPKAPQDDEVTRHKWTREMPQIKLPRFRRKQSKASQIEEDIKFVLEEEKKEENVDVTESTAAATTTTNTLDATPDNSNDSKGLLERSTSIIKKNEFVMPEIGQETQAEGQMLPIESLLGASSSAGSSTDWSASHSSFYYGEDIESHLDSAFASNATTEEYRAALNLANSEDCESNLSSLGRTFDTLDMKVLEDDEFALARCPWIWEVDQSGSDPTELLDSDDDHCKKETEQVASGLHIMRLCHACGGGGGDTEALEIEANLSDYKWLEEGTTATHDNLTKSPATPVFKTRAALEAEIIRCELAIKESERSEIQSTNQKIGEWRERLEMLKPLREFHPARPQLEQKIKDLTDAMQQLDKSNEVERCKLINEKVQLQSQLQEELIEEEMQQNRESRPMLETQTHRSKDSVKKLSLFSSKDFPCSSLVGAKIEIDTERTMVSALSSRSNSMADICIHYFAAAPLAFVDTTTGTHHVCPVLDFEYEIRALTQSLKDAEAVGSRSNVEFDIATTDRLTAFLSKSNSRIMHLSCHGHPEYLAIENGFGGMQILPVRDLKRFIGAGTSSLELVFVSACHSKAAGQAFLDAGIRHVICCRQDDKFRDEGAIEFARSFYRALALKNTIRQAFNMAREAMRVSPLVKDSKAEYEKFILLPDLPESDPHHDVHICSRSNASVTSDNRAEFQFEPISPIVPRLPQYFVGREMDMYTLLEALRSNDVVRVQGPPGIGKTCLMAAMTRYIHQRHKSFLFDKICWLPAQRDAIDANDALYLEFSRIMDMIAAGGDMMPVQLKKLYTTCWGRIVRLIHDKRILLVIQSNNRLGTDAARRNLDNFIHELLKVSNAKVVLDQDTLVDSTAVHVKPLDFESSVLLFSRLTQSTSASAQQIIKALSAMGGKEQANLEPSQKIVMEFRRKRTLERIGGGIPCAIRKSAQAMSDEALVELLRLSKRPTLIVSSRFELDTTITELEVKEKSELGQTQFLKARDTRETIEELRCLRQSFPTLEDLEEIEFEIQESLDRAISARNYDAANQLQESLSSLLAQIEKEVKSKEAMMTIERMASF